MSDNPFRIGDIVEMPADPGCHRMVVDLNPVETSMPQPCVTTAWCGGNGKIYEGVIQCCNLQQVPSSRWRPVQR